MSESLTRNEKGMLKGIKNAMEDGRLLLTFFSIVTTNLTFFCQCVQLEKAVIASKRVHKKNISNYMNKDYLKICPHIYKNANKYRSTLRNLKSHGMKEIFFSTHLNGEESK